MIAKSTPTPIKPSLSIILATTSPFKKALFERLQLAFTLADPKVDETPLPGESAPELAIRLAQSKAEAGLVASQALQHTQPVSRSGDTSARQEPTQLLVIGCDQVPVTEQGDILHKPGTPDKAAEQLRRLKGKTVQFHTAVYVLQPNATSMWPTALPTTQMHASPQLRGAGHTDITTVTYREDLCDDTIARYLNQEAAWQCAGAIQSEALGITLLRKIESSDPTALIGLPLIGLSHLLRQFGVTLP